MSATWQSISTPRGNILGERQDKNLKVQNERGHRRQSLGIRWGSRPPDFNIGSRGVSM